MNSQAKKLEEVELSARIRDYRIRARITQDELGEQLGVSGNYISMIELGKKIPGPPLRKLFESIELSPVTDPVRTQWKGIPGGRAPGNPLLAMWSSETLTQNVADVAGKLAQVGDPEKRVAIANLREWLDELERRLQTSSGELSEAQQIAVQASKPGGSRGTK